MNSVPEPWGPQTVPEIECGKCDIMHHIDAATGEYQGHCRECWGFLRRPTEQEHRQFSDFIVWNAFWMEERGEL